MAEIYTAVIEYTDGRTDRVENVGICIKPTVVRDEVLYLQRQNGNFADRETVTAYPLCNVRSWRLERK